MALDRTDAHSGKLTVLRNGFCLFHIEDIPAASPGFQRRGAAVLRELRAAVLPCARLASSEEERALHRRTDLWAWQVFFAGIARHRHKLIGRILRVLLKRMSENV